jgi:hypothetical protein
MNSMNGDTVVNPDLDIDEGFYSAAAARLNAAQAMRPAAPA